MSLIFKIETNFCEYPFLKNVTSYMSESFFREYDFYICGLEYLHTPPAVGDNVIVLILADEYDTIPPYLDDVRCVFKTGVSKESSSNKLIPFPLGHTKLYTDTDHMHSISDRLIDVFFSGQVITRDRADMIRHLRDLESENQYNINVNISGGFLQGLDGNTYSDTMRSSKICICPAGTTMPESFRYFEAFKSGTIVFTKDYIPETDLYKDAPVIKMRDWSQLKPAVKHILNDVTLLKSYLERTSNYHLNNYSEKACAELILSKCNI